MKESKVQLFSAALAMNKDQGRFVTNQYKDSLEEQKAVNLHLMNCITQLEKSYQTILEDIRKQEKAFNLQKRSQRQNYLHLKDIFLEMARTSNSYRSYIKKQERSLHTMNEYINKQDGFNKLFTRRSHSQYELLNRLQQSVNKHELYNKTAMEKQDTLEKMNEIMLKNMKQLELQLEEAFEEVKILVEKVLQVKESIRTLLCSLPPNYPIKQVIVGGVAIPLESLVFVNNETDIATFSNGTETISIPLQNIDTIHWE
ncbi:hypothetical protein ACIQYS_18885 [Psychrobacillus sp. NPDC096426]|uniref:hypothetical protein n=1 Tax=Psychrobacillus sp. NPDC096426 TaxID=3364491 RepID=UPI0037F89CBC